MKRLVIFKANSNAFISASKLIFNWDNMLDLQLDENELTLFPKEVKYLTALQRLSISRNKIKVSYILIETFVVSISQYVEIIVGSAG